MNGDERGQIREALLVQLADRIAVAMQQAVDLGVPVESVCKSVMFLAGREADR